VKVRWTPGSLRFPALKGKLQIVPLRGQMIAKAWPRKRGPSKSPSVRNQNAWFKEANRLTKTLAPTQMVQAIAMTKGTGLYPRDLLLRQMSGGMFDIIDEDGVNYQPRTDRRETVVFQGVILQLATPITFVANIAQFVTWPLPVLDTLGFWSAGAPTLITVPPGINVVELHCGISVTPNSGNLLQSIFATALPLAAETSNEGWNLISGQASSGPVPVIAGDVFSLRGVCSKTRTTDPNRRTFLALNVLDAD